MSPHSDAPQTPSRRTIFRSRRSLVLAGANLIAYGGLTLMVACGESPTGVPAARQPNAAALAPTGPSNTVLSAATYATGLQRDVPLAAPVTGSFVADANGGSFKLQGTGLSINVAPGTIKQPITITVTALAGSMLAYDFQPAGSRFPKGIDMQQELQHTNWSGKDLSKFGVGYFAQTSDVDEKQNRALIAETVRANIDTRGQKMMWSVYHFSGYMVSTGFAAF